jgi:hypothetical protein
MHELCRFAGLFSLVPTKNLRFFHWTEQKVILWITCGKALASSRSKGMHKSKYPITTVDSLLLTNSRVAAMFGLSHNKIYDLISEAIFVWRFFHSKSKGDAHEAVKTTSSQESKQR